ncbi:MAG: serine/threonine protein kinase [Armatimonadota bacterium]|nr:serine/threonine protein kinase [Armatimonadota bacterium]
MADCIETLSRERIGEYALVREIGRATHYTLYQVADPLLGRMAVIKLLHAVSGPEGDASDATGPRESAHALATRLQREARTLESLSHPNIPAIYGTGEHQGRPYLATEYLNGQPLRHRLDQGPLPLEEAVSILEQVAAALDAVHAQGILHRDIRASSVIVLNDGCVKLAEFGMARQPEDATVTLMGAKVGEPAYLSPERLRDHPASRAADLWALGVLLYEMLAGRPPFVGANFAMVAHQVLMDAPAPVPALSPALQTVLRRALEKDPERRYGAAGEMARDLRRAAEPSLKAMPRLSSPWAESSRREAVSGLAAGAALALAASLILGLFLSRPAPAPSRPAPVVSQIAPAPPQGPRIYATPSQFGTPPAVSDPFRKSPQAPADMH